MNILIFGYFGFYNFGDEWLLEVLKKLLFKFGNNNKRIFVLYNIKKTVIKNNIIYIPRWNILEVIKAISNSDTVISCGGVFQDQTSILSFVYYFFILVLAKILGKNTVLLSTEFITEKLPLKIIKVISMFTDYIFLRNNTDIEIVKRFSSKNTEIQFCPDICFSEVKWQIKKNNEIKNLGVILKISETFDIETLEKMCVNLSNSYKLIFIPFHLYEDYNFCLRIARKIKSCEIRVWDRPENYFGLLKDVNLIISSRLHGIVLSICLGIPFVCVSNESKLVRFLKTMLDAEPVTISTLEKENFKIDKYILSYDINKFFELKYMILEKFEFLTNKKII